MKPQRSDIQRINIQLPRKLKATVEAMAARRGQSLSAFFRESVEERIEAIRKAEKEALLREAYEHMAADAERTAGEYDPVDVEGWE